MDKGKKLHELRIKAGLSQVDAASKVGVTKQTLYKYEKGIVTNIPSDVIEKLAVLYDSSPGEIMGWDEQLINSYVNNAADQELLDLFHNMLPEAQESVVQIIKSLQRQPDLPYLKNDKLQ